MLNRFLILGCTVIVLLAFLAIPFPDGAVGILFAGIISAIAIIVLRRYTDQKDFITKVFITGLVLRLGFGILIHVANLRPFFGGDSLAYDYNGWELVNYWSGKAAETMNLAFQDDPGSGAGWGMNYLTAVIYLLLGRNIFAAQSFCAVVGAATGPMVFFCAHKIFGNLKVARVAGMGVAIFPSFVIWSGQLLKDGLIIFLLVTAMTLVLQLQKKFNYSALLLLILSMFGILSLRFYIFYMVAVAVAGSFIVGMSTTQRSITRSLIMMAVIAFGLAYLGVGRQASVELPRFTSLERIQSSRSDLVHAAGSGFGDDADVSTAEGALSAIPTGFMYLMLAPFPWQAANVRQMITIPEVLAWWAMIPMVIIGLIYAVKHRLRNAFPVLVFSMILTIAYSVFQGNVGTAYRQRTQIQVFLFILFGVGWVVYHENKENKRILDAAAKRRVDDALRARQSPMNV